MLLLHLGYQNYINTDRITTVLKSGSAPITNAIHEARRDGRLIDCTFGRRTRSVIFTDSGHVVLSATLPESLGERWKNGDGGR